MHLKKSIKIRLKIENDKSFRCIFFANVIIIIFIIIDH